MTTTKSKIIVETVNEGRLICIVEANEGILLLNREDAMWLLELLPPLIARMPVNVRADDQ